MCIQYGFTSAGYNRRGRERVRDREGASDDVVCHVSVASPTPSEHTDDIDPHQTMNTLQQAQLLAHLVHWRLTFGRHDSDYVPHGLPERFVSARTVASRIADDSVVISCGIGGNARCAAFFWAVRESFQQTGHPRGLTWISVAGQGGRGRVPGTVEELGVPGLLHRYIAGHVETAKSLLALADRGELELYTMPQGQLALLVEAQARGELEVRSEVGVGTFLDPRTGSGAGLSPAST